MPDFLWKYRNEVGLAFAVLAVFALTLILDQDYTLKLEYNIHEVLRQTALLGIFALGAGIVIISGGIDLSSGSVIAFGGSICCMIMLATAKAVRPDVADPTQNLPVWIILLAIGGTLLAGFLIGTLHTWLITVIRLPPFVATLASLVGLRSLARILNQSVTKSLGDQSTKINIQDQLFGSLGSTWWIPLLVFAILAVLFWVMMNKTVLGRHLYAMGGNEEAARLSGIRTNRLKWVAYCIGAMTASVAGILYSSEVGSADPQTQGRGYELFAIAAAVVGGCSLQGGVGLIPGIALGALFLRMVIDAVAKIIGAGSDDYEGLIVGFLVVLAVAVNELFSSAGGLRKQFFPGVLGVLTIIILTSLVGVVGLVMAGTVFAVIAAGCTLVLLVAAKVAGHVLGGSEH